MNDNATTENPGTVNLSTTLSPGAYDTAYGAGKMDPKPAEAPAKPESLDDVLRDEMKKQDADAKAEKPEAADDDKEAKPDPEAKAKPEAKPEVKPEPKPEAKEAAPAEKPEAKPDTAKEPPARLLPKAREVWGNVPREVKAEFERFEREVETERESARESKAFHEELKEYATLAKGVNTTVKAALDRYVDFDKQLSQDFGKGMAALAQDQRKTPQEAVTSLLRAYGMTPAQFAQAVVKNPAAFQGQPMQAQQAPAQPKPDPVAQTALREVQALKQQLATQQLEQTIIAPFAASHPRFAELQGPIEKLIKSGMVPDSLSPAERLEVAYDMAERLNPSPHRPTSAFADPAVTASDDAGRKSVRGAPSNGVMPSADDNLPLDDWLRKELRKSG